MKISNILFCIILQMGLNVEKLYWQARRPTDSCPSITTPTTWATSARWWTIWSMWCRRPTTIPFGTPICDPSSAINPDYQPFKYNGKELDMMHGLNTYDYGARQRDPILGRWDCMDPLCEKYYSMSPYAYCHDNSVHLFQA